LSHECLVSFKAREALRNLKTKNPEFWKELTSSCDLALPNISDVLPEDELPDARAEDEAADDSDLPVATLVTSLTNDHLPIHVGVRTQGTLASIAEAESMDMEPLSKVEIEGNVVRMNSDGHHHGSKLPVVPDMEANPRGEGKRRTKANRWYDQKTFWRHDDDDDEGEKSKKAQRK